MPHPSKLSLPVDLGAFGALSPGLHIVATPIGNLGDISFRALAALASADVVYCEDTRHTRHLTERFGLSPKLLPYHEHNADKARPEILQRLADGQAVALVSDAGTPLISDPGYKLVREALAAGHGVSTVPGASALTAALAIAGLPTDRFLFLGFLPPKQAARRRALEEVRAVGATLVLYEAPTRLAECLADMALILGGREAAIARELTKLHESLERGSLTALAAAHAEAAPPKGEIVIVVGPPDAADAAMSESSLDAALAAALERLSLKAAVAEITAETGLPRRVVYARALKLAAAGEP